MYSGCRQVFQQFAEAKMFMSAISGVSLCAPTGLVRAPTDYWPATVWVSSPLPQTPFLSPEAGEEKLEGMGAGCAGDQGVYPFEEACTIASAPLAECMPFTSEACSAGGALGDPRMGKSRHLVNTAPAISPSRTLQHCTHNQSVRPGIAGLHQLRAGSLRSMTHGALVKGPDV